MPKHLAVILGRVDGLDPIDALAINLVNGLAQRGYRVTLLASSVMDVQLDDGVTLITHGATSRLVWLDLIRTRRWLNHTLAQIKPDVTIALQSFFRAQINVPTQGLLRQRLNAAIDDNATFIDRLVKRAASMLPSMMLGQRFEKQMLHDDALEALVALSPLCELELKGSEKKEGVEVCLASMPIPQQSIEPTAGQAMRGKLARALGLSPDSYWIAHPFQTPGRGGLETMVRAFKPLIDEGVDAVLLLAGPYRYTHLAWIGELGLRDAVRFVGKTDRGEDLIAACDLAVCPTSDDPAGWGVLPALGTQTPVVTTTASGLAETIKQRGGTVLASPAEALALLEAVRSQHRDWLEGGSQGSAQPWPPPENPPLIEVVDRLVKEQGALASTDNIPQSP